MTAALNVHEQQLGELIVNFNAFFRSFAAQSSSLRTTVAELPSSLSAVERGFAALDAAFPPARTFALDIIPGVKATPATINAALPWIEQVTASLAPSEIGGVAEGLAAAAPWIAQLQSEQVPFQKQSDLFSKCLTKVVFPAGQHQAPGRGEHLGRRKLQGVLVLAGGPGRHRPELRRQRHDGALPARQRRPDAALGASVDPRHQSARAAPARPRLAGTAGHPPGLPGHGASVQAARALLHPDAAQLSTVRLPRAPPTGAGDELPPTATRAG